MLHLTNECKCIFHLNVNIFLLNKIVGANHNFSIQLLYTTEVVYFFFFKKRSRYIELFLYKNTNKMFVLVTLKKHSR